MILFSFPEQATLGRQLPLVQGHWECRPFPDGESYVRVHSDVKGKAAAILCSLNQPDSKILPLLFLARTLKDLGATRVTLIAPYLGYMRQDTRFQPGEALTSEIFAATLSPFIDTLITIDPHLHRHHHLEEIYRCACICLTAAPLMAEWIKQHVPNALLVGPDKESEQWVGSVASAANAPYIVLEKNRHGDRDVTITLPDIGRYHDRTPVLIDDIIATGTTLIKTIDLLHAQGFDNNICLVTHGLFPDDAYAQLQATKTPLFTADTIPHPTNALPIALLLEPCLMAGVDIGKKGG